MEWKGLKLPFSQDPLTADAWWDALVVRGGGDSQSDEVGFLRLLILLTDAEI